MMSRITLSLKKQVHEPEMPSRLFNKSNNNKSFDIQFSRDRSFSDATVRTRSRANSRYPTDGADAGINFSRTNLPPLRRLSTIDSAYSNHATKSPPAYVTDMHGDVGDGLERHELEVTQLKLSRRRDEETLWYILGGWFSGVVLRAHLSYFIKSISPLLYY